MRNTKNEQNFGRFTELSHVTTARMRMREVGGAMGVFTKSVLSIPGCKIFDKNLMLLHLRTLKLLIL